MNRKTLLLWPLFLAAGAATAFACLWDYDTLQMERMRFPGVLEIITGKFVRHSRAYYEWRIGDRQKKLEAKPGDPALTDDLAVAYVKLGRPEEGIAVLEPVLAANPQRYETISNLGTLLFFAGKLDESKEHIRRALEINSDAHFGRERFQLLLTEYLQQSEHAKLGVMSAVERYTPRERPEGFARYVLEAKYGAGSLDNAHQLSTEQLDELRAATKGVLGMMHFADHRSPILLEALGDLLLSGQMEANSTQLAARAYLRAAKLTDDSPASERFREMSEEAIANHFDFDKNANHEPFNLQQQLATEVAEADAWFAVIEAKENEWIAAGADVDAEFSSLYYDSLDATVAAAELQVKSEPKQPMSTLRPPKPPVALVVAGAICLGLPIALVCLAIVAMVWRPRSISFQNRREKQHVG
jgi:tetratricopeptide (TPR) repeat protein